jgi:hypothetical protein
MFPIPAWSKRPGGIVRSHSEDWSKDPAQWERWWVSTGGCNFGVAATPSRLIVVDVDADPTGRPYFDSFWVGRLQRGELAVTTPSGGWHIYCRLPDDVPSDHVHQVDWEKRRINTRARNGYVVAPWCQTRRGVDDQASDGCYSIYQGDAPQWAPPELLAKCVWSPSVDPPALAPPVLEFGADGYPVDPVERIKSIHFVERLLVELRKAVPGERNNCLNETAFSLGRLAAGGRIVAAVAEALVCAEGEALGLTREEARATARSGMRGGLAAGPEPDLNTAIVALLAAAGGSSSAPPAPYAPRSPAIDPDAIPEPIVERLLYEGFVTVLSGHGGSGKTTLGASLMAAAAAGARDYQFGRGLDDKSDVLARPAAWVFVSYEGGQLIDLHMQAWRVGAGLDAGATGRCRIVNRRGPLVMLNKREAVVDAAHAKEIAGAVDEMRALWPDLPVVLAMDNVTSAIEDSTDPVQAVLFMRGMRAIADTGAAVLLFAHPPKRGGALIYGAHQLFSLADICCEIEVVRQGADGWTQFVSFEKHRPAMNGLGLELQSARIAKPLRDLPEGWGGGNARARERMLKDLCLPFISQIRVRAESEKETAKAGVRRVEAKTVAPQTPFGPPTGAPAGPPPPMGAVYAFTPRKT